MTGLLKMAGMTKFMLSMFVLLIAHQRSVEAVFTMNETCAYYSEGYIADPDNCQAWGYCSGGVLYAQGTCGKGLLYDSYNGICNYASDVQCGSTADNICANLASSGYIANPSNCNEYCYCENNQIVECNNCPTTQLYNPSEVQCQYSYSCPTDSVCRLVQNNAFVGASTCGEYIRCLDGAGSSAKKCSNNYYYNNLSGMCQPTNPCTSSTGANASPSAYSPTPAACSAYNTTKGGIQYFSDGSTCYGYYSCSSSSGSGTWKRCKFSTHFDPTIQTCVSPMSYLCPYNRCGNINLQFITALNTDCKNYYVCTNQQASSVSYSCSNAGFPYFDEIIGGCVETEPNYAICTTNTTTTVAPTTTVAATTLS